VALRRDKSTLNTDWILGEWYARLSFRHLDSLTEQCTGSSRI
jgi:hypothetical protein